MYFMLDNYDSFVYNLSAYVKELGREILVKRADQITVAEVEAMNPEGIIISPGPGKPSEAHLSHALLDRFAGEIPILGVCLGHQVIVEKYDGRVEKGARHMHGKVTPIINTGEGIFRGLPEKFSVTRYHSLVAKGELPSCLNHGASFFQVQPGVVYSGRYAAGLLPFRLRHNEIFHTAVFRQ